MTDQAATQLGVGIIGINPDRGWAREAHAPAIGLVPGLRLAAVASRSKQRADAVAASLGLPRGYGDASELIADPAVDIVTVAASVPAHHELIAAALGVGKHVLTEWPVTTHLDRTVELTEQAAAAGLRTAVGLQAAVNPALVRARRLVVEGAVGRVLHATVYSTTAGFGRDVPRGELYLEEPATGMNLPTIQFAHSLDAARRVLGDVTPTGTQLTVQFPTLRVDGSGHDTVQRTIADHVLLQGRLAGGGALSLQVVGGRPADDTPFRFEIVGEMGTLVLTGGAPRGFQAGRLALSVDGEPVAVDEGFAAPAVDSVLNVACVYAALRDDIRSADVAGESKAPDFAAALALSREVDNVLTAAVSGSSR